MKTVKNPKYIKLDLKDVNVIRNMNKRCHTKITRNILA